jgi:hypothetical protein
MLPSAPSQPCWVVGGGRGGGGAHAQLHHAHALRGGGTFAGAGAGAGAAAWLRAVQKRMPTSKNLMVLCLTLVALTSCWQLAADPSGHGVAIEVR